MSVASGSIRLDRLFAACVELNANARSAWLDEACGDDWQLRAAVERLLEADDVARSEAFLEWSLTADPSKSAPDAFLGAQLGPYQVNERIAAGATGVVYRATRVEGFQHEVAIKVLRPWLCDAEGIARFKGEQQALADLPHPHIARLLDAGITQDGLHYLAMEFIDGYRLDEAVAVTQPELRTRIEWFLTICRVVAFAHERGIAHRDLKPANVMMRKERASASLTPTITDFGLAKIIGADGGALTATGEVLGTPGYMAPEQIQGGSTKIGFHTDVYGLGAVLYFLLTGKPPFRRGSISELLRDLERHDAEPPASLVPGIPADLNTICLKCLEKQPGHRYPSAEELADDVQRYLAGFPVRARAISPSERMVRWANRNRTVAILAGSLLAVLLVALVVTTSLFVVAERRRGESEQEREAALDTIDRLLTEVSKTLKQQPGSTELRKSLLAAAKQAYDARLAVRQADTKRTRVEAATSSYRLAQILDHGMDYERRDRFGREALTQFQQLATQYPDEHEYRFDEFHCRLLMHEWDEAYKIISTLSTQYPLPHYRDALATAACTYASGLRVTDPLRAEDILQQGLQVAEQLVADFPEKPEYSRLRASCLLRLAELRYYQHQFADSLRYAEQSLPMRERQVREFPQEVGFRDELRRSLVTAADAAFMLGHRAKASDYRARQTAVAQRGVELTPQDFRPWNMLIVALDSFIVMYEGEWHIPEDDFLDAIQTLESSLTLARRFWPTNARLRLQQAVFLADCPLEERRNLLEAQEFTEGLQAADVMAYEAYFLGIVRLRTGSYDEALECFAKAGTTATQTSCSTACLYLALTSAKLGDWETTDRILQQQAPYAATQLFRRLSAEIQAIERPASPPISQNEHPRAHAPGLATRET